MLCTWSIQFMQYIKRNKETRKFLKNLNKNGPYKLKEIEDDGSTTRKPKHRWETKDDLSGEDLKQYEADIEEMNLILLAIPNDIYNYIDAGENAKDMWELVRRLMEGTDLSEQERHSRFMNEFDKFTSEVGESLTSVYEHFSRLPEWSKYVTNVHLSKNLRKDHYDALFDPLQHYEINVNASREKRAAKTHDPLALVVKTYANHVDIKSKNVRNSGGYVRRTGDTQGDVVGNVIVQRNTRNSNNVQRIPRTTANSGNGPNVQCYNCNAKGHYARDCSK
ncbi:integrase, catalytic region, zinc finger, CCHC-type containing protein [Tanacetum coccineum]